MLGVSVPGGGPVRTAGGALTGKAETGIFLGSAEERFWLMRAAGFTDVLCEPAIIIAAGALAVTAPTVLALTAIACGGGGAYIDRAVGFAMLVLGMPGGRTVVPASTAGEAAMPMAGLGGGA